MLRFFSRDYINKHIFICLLLGGCSLNHDTQSPSKIEISNDGRNVTSIKNQPQITESETSSHLTQCNRDLESLRTVSQTEYRRYAAEYDALLKSSAGFMTVKDDVSPEVAALARPKFQFALVNLCYRIKDALAQTLINQAGGR